MIETIKAALRTNTDTELNLGNGITLIAYDDGSGSIMQNGTEIGAYDLATMEWSIEGSIGCDPYSYMADEAITDIDEALITDIATAIANLL